MILLMSQTPITNDRFNVSANITEGPVNDHGIFSLHVLKFDVFSGADKEDGARLDSEHRHTTSLFLPGVQKTFAASHQQKGGRLLHRQFAIAGRL